MTETPAHGSAKRADVVALRDAPASPDSLAEEREEGHRG